MFGRRKKPAKIEKVFSEPIEEQSAENEGSKEDENVIEVTSQTQNVSSSDEANSPELNEAELDKQERLDKVKSKISKILQSSNVEIVDENEGDEYIQETDEDKKKQQDYDELKALFGNESKNKKNELTLSIDDFDYTYTGDYIEEYDIQHTKSYIKRIKFKRKYSKAFVRAAIIISLVVVIGLGSFFAYYFTRKQPVYLKNVTLSNVEDNYYVNQYFDYTGLYFNLEYSDGTTNRVPVTSNNLTRATGYFNETNGMMTAVGKADLIFTYQGFNMTYTVTIRQSEINSENPLEVDYGNGLFKLKAGDVITSDLLSVYANFSIGKTLLNINQYSLQVSVNGNVNYVSCVRTTNGYVLPTGISATNSSTIFRITYQVGDGQTVELLIKQK